MTDLASPPAPGARPSLDELLRLRRDVRRFRSDPLPPDFLQHLVDAADLAPSVGLSQPWRIASVEDPARRAAIRAIFERCNSEALAEQPSSRRAMYARLKLAGLEQAPCHLAVFSDLDPLQGGGLGRKTMPEMLEYSTVIAVHTMWLAAQAMGVGMGWVSILDPRQVGTVLDAPASWRLIAYLCIGFAVDGSDVPELQRNGWERRRPSTLHRR